MRIWRIASRAPAIAGVLLLTLLGSACSVSETSSPPLALEAPSPTPANSLSVTAVPESNDEPEPVVVTELSGQIVVNTSSGELFLVDPTGTDRVDLTDRGLAPVWRPDGARIAWSDLADGDGAIASSAPDGSDRKETNTLFAGYFGLWDPTSTTLGFLGNAPPGTGLVLDDGSTGELDETIDSDTFYYFSWSPDGTQWVVHSGSGLHITERDGSRTEIDLTDSFFRAPVWTPDGHIIVAITAADRTVVIKLDPATLEFEELLDVGSATTLVNFVLDPTGRHLAIESADAIAGGTEFGDNITAISYQQQAAAEVVVYDMQSGEVTPIHDERIGAAWFSPDGNHLALLVTERAAPPQSAQWLIWTSADATTSDNPQIFRTEKFVPTRAFVSTYVPFYDQFAQSVSPWSPDSSAFVYTAASEDGTAGVFVQRAVPDESAARITDGAVAFWSPS